MLPSWLIRLERMLLVHTAVGNGACLETVMICLKRRGDKLVCLLIRSFGIASETGSRIKCLGKQAGIFAVT